MIYDLIIVGAGAAGLFCAKNAAINGLNIAIIDSQNGPGKKLAVCGGGVGNVTNVELDAKKHYYSENPFFAISTLKAFPQRKILEYLTECGLNYNLRDNGCYFTGGRASDLASYLYDQAENAGAKFFFNSKVTTVENDHSIFSLTTHDNTLFQAKNVLISTGGRSYPSLGGNDFGLRIAKQFGHHIVETKPALAPFYFSLKTINDLDDLSGIALQNIKITVAQRSFEGSLVFRPDGIGGIAVFKAQAHWQKTAGEVKINWINGIDFHQWLTEARKTQGTILFKNKLTHIIPKRLAYALTWIYPFSQKQIAQLSASEIEKLHILLTEWTFQPESKMKWEDAEVMLGGVDTEHISSKTLESQLCKGLYFAGEVLDVTGQLGGYNLHWAFASGTKVAQSLMAPTEK